MRTKFYFLFIFAIFSSCTLAPKYERPAPSVSLEKADITKPNITITPWNEFFQSEDLQRVINIALENNRDLRIANLNMEAAMQLHNVVRADLLPTVEGVGSMTRQKNNFMIPGLGLIEQFRGNLAVTAYEVDFFGRLRSLKKAALEEFLASKEARNIAEISIITQTAQAYITYILDSEILAIAKDNLDAQSETYKFSQLRYENGIASQSDLLTASDINENSIAVYETYKKVVVEDKNALMTLMGVFDESLLPKTFNINDVKINEALLDYTPSDLLLSRPDIKEAEHLLRSSNADIGAARAAFFPSITLTGSFGYQSSSLSNLFSPKTSSWVFAPQVNLPIFTAGRNIANLKLADLRKKIEIANYEKVIQTAFSEVSNELAQRESVVNRLQAYNEMLKVRQQSYDITQLRFREGLSSRPEVIAGRLYFLTAKQNQATLKQEYLINLINLYKVLGGGSELEAVENSKPVK